METLKNRFDFAVQGPVEKHLEAGLRLLLVPTRPIVTWPILKTLELLGFIPYPHPKSWLKLAGLLSLFVATLLFSVAYLVLIFTVGLPVWAIDYWLYRRETEEAGLPKKELSRDAVRHGVRKYLASRYIQSSFFTGDVCDVSSFAGMGESHLRKISQRRIGLRPSTLKGLPHRQFDQRPSREMFLRAQNLIFSVNFASVEGIICGCPSLFEGTGAKAIRIVSPLDYKIPAQRGEFCHIHTVDGSWHCVLSPADAAKVVENGWGELWPNACLACEKYHGVVLLYGPRNEIELKMLSKILLASYNFATNVKTSARSMNGDSLGLEHDDLESKQETTTTPQMTNSDIVQLPPKEEEIVLSSFTKVAVGTEPAPTLATDNSEVTPPSSETATLPDDEVKLDTDEEILTFAEEEQTTGQTSAEEKEEPAVDWKETVEADKEPLLQTLMNRGPLGGTLEVVVDRAKNLNPLSDAKNYVILRIDDDDNSVKQTDADKQGARWGEHFNFSVTDGREQKLNVEVVGKSEVGDTIATYGEASVSIQDIVSHGSFIQHDDAPYFKFHKSVTLSETDATLKLRMKFAPECLY